MADTLSIALAQINTTLGDITGNEARILDWRARAALAGADLVVFPELAICGYPPEDLVMKPAVVEACESALERLATITADGGPALLVGTPRRVDGKLYNCAVLLDEGRIVATRRKVDLPNYGVFDEKRVFAAGDPAGPVVVRGFRLGVIICEDMWTPDVAETLVESGAEGLVVINGSPFETGKTDTRLSLAVARVVETGLPLAYLNQVCGQDELVFDGGSFVLNRDRKLVARLPTFQEHLSLTRWQRDGDSLMVSAGEVLDHDQGLGAIYAALTLGLKDYVTKNGFPGVVLGLSGGIDSALAAALAVDALGADKVWAVMMPSPYTSSESLEDAAAVATALGIRLDTISIGPAMAAFDQMLAPVLAGRAPDITEENLQSRARGVTLMALSNKFGPMVLSTGNKSELSVGYATLYGDMCGGYSVLKDVYKTTVFALCEWRNVDRPIGALGPVGPVIPQRVIDKPPTAELKPNQTDQDTLPPYDVLDGILSCLVEGEHSIAQTVACGYDPATVTAVWRMLDRAEYKRRQAAPGVKITPRAFGRDRRYPITNRFFDALR
ncbi:MAG: NAD+ synthase [Alphaproteobacteria bacterium]|nr:NAD+ synthase [Alphaproteobacteria bacterium]TAD87426.1 MAG: NAD+ synthase [Alphaproteobacteria bacterium]